MCDYSVMMVPNRLAIEGEELVTHRFQSGSIGPVSCFDYDTWSNKRATSIWQKLKAFCSFGSEPTPVVCIPPGARVRLEGSPKTFKEQFTLGSSEEATFVQLSVEINQHRDALCFDNSAIVLLQLLPEGQRVRVLRLSSHEDFQSQLDELQNSYTRQNVCAASECRCVDVTEMEGGLQWLNGNIELNALTSQPGREADVHLEKLLREYGQQGWELVQVLHGHELTNDPQYRLILKAEKPLD